MTHIAATSSQEAFQRAKQAVRLSASRQVCGSGDEFRALTRQLVTFLLGLRAPAHHASPVDDFCQHHLAACEVR
jgi:hypothetical protein